MLGMVRAHLGVLDMSRTLLIPDELYDRLDAAARQQGLDNVEQLLAAWQSREEETSQRQRAVQAIDALRARLFATYGEMPDSTDLIREDRAR
jgi:hypothetical protein